MSEQKFDFPIVENLEALGGIDHSDLEGALFQLRLIENSLNLKDASGSDDHVMMELVGELSSVIKTKLMNNPLYENENTSHRLVLKSDSDLYDHLLEVAEVLSDHDICINPLIRIFNGSDPDKEAEIFKQRMAHIMCENTYESVDLG